MKCTFCGKEFDEAAGRRSCGSCALFGGCKNVRCPYCGYESPLEPGVFRWLRKKDAPASGADAQPACAVETEIAVPAGTTTGLLASGRPGDTGTVAQLETQDTIELQKLLAMGLLPGTRLRLLQRTPAFVFQAGFSQFTVDEALAGLIRMCWDPD
jgi:Fe2+ transport system protein FeoA